MSKQRYDDALLQGYRGPYFPESVNEIIKITDPWRRGFNRELINRALGVAELPVKMFSPTTSDGYEWFVGINIGWDAVAILFPWAQDWDFHDGSQLDRSPALYVGRGTLAAADRLVVRFNTALESYYDQVTREAGESV